MEITVQPEEVSLLKSILTDYLSDLRMEIANTEDYDMREQLKRDEATVKGFIARLGQASSAAA